MYTVTCESTCDLPFSYLQSRNCDVVFYTYNIDGEDFVDNMGRDDNALPALYEALKTKRPMTSQINTETYEQFFLQQLQKGDVLHLAFSSGLSQSVSNAKKAAQNLSAQNLPHKLVVLDTLCGGGGFGLFVDGVLDQRDAGATFEQLCNWAEQHRQNLHHFFFSTDLTYFRRSGRVSGPVMLIGNLLHLCPIMRVKADGKIVAYTQILSSRKAIAKLVAEMEQNAQDGKNYSGKLWIQHSNCPNTAQRTKEAIVAAFPNLSQVQIMDVGTVMSCHCGPNTVAIYFWGTAREE